MRSATPVSALMTTRITTVGPSDRMEVARSLFELRGFHHLPVLENQKLVGIISYSDYLRVVRSVFENKQDARTNEQILNATLVRDVMQTELVTLRPDDNVDQALQIFLRNQFHSLPVVDEQMHLVGILTSTDMMRLMEDVFARDVVPESGAEQA